MTALTREQIDRFWRDGVLVVEDAVTPEELASLRRVFEGWVEESRGHDADYGVTLDGRARFDLEPGHSASSPALRRVQSPEEISQIYAGVMRNARTVDLVAELIGPSIRFHHGKVNSKLPGAATKVKFHQDFTFEPMSNDDVITALLFVDDVTEQNGALEVVPGSHKGPLYSLWHDGVFTGAVADEVVEQHRHEVVKCTGRAGSVCLMHANLLHGSAPNLTGESRTLYIATYYAEDAIELSPNALPSRFTHELVRGAPSGRVRCTSYQMRLPEVPKQTSFFAQQALAGEARPQTGTRPPSADIRVPPAVVKKLGFSTDAGAGERARIGLLVLQSDQTIESECRLLTDLPGVSLYHARLANDTTVTPETLARMEAELPRAARLLPDYLGLASIGYGCTSGSSIIGEDRVAAILARTHPGVPSTNPLTAAKAALQVLGVGRLGLLTPYSPEVTATLQARLVEAGVEITAVGSFYEGDDRVVGRIDRQSILRAAITVGGSAEIDGVFISCTSLRAAAIVEQAEQALGKPVTASNHALAWHLLRLAGIEDRPQGAGRLFREPLARGG